MLIRPELALSAILLAGSTAAAQGGPDPVWQVSLPSVPPPTTPLGAAGQGGLRTTILLGSQTGAIKLLTLGPDGALEGQVTGPPLGLGTSAVAAASGATGEWHIALRLNSGATGPPGSGSPLGGEDIGLLRIAHDGAPLSAVRLGTSRDDRPRALISAPDGGAFLAGTTTRSGFSFGVSSPRTVGYVARIDPAGQLLWSRIVPGPGQPGSNLEVTPHCIALDMSLGQLYVGGEARSSPGGPRLSARFTLGLDGAAGGAHFGDLPRGAIIAMAVDDAGTLFMAGENDLTRGTELLGRDGAGTWRRPLATPAGPWGRCRVGGLSAGAAGAIALSSSTSHTDPQLGSAIRLDHATGDGQITPLMVGTPEAGSSTTGEVLTGIVGGALVAVGLRDGEPTALLALGPRPFLPGCPGSAHSGGRRARLDAAGAGSALDPTMLLHVGDAPPRTFGIFLCSPLAGLVPGAGGGTGTLCLGGPIGRFDGPTEIWQASELGSAHRVVSLASLPTPGLSRSAMAGELWHFQAWFRDGASTGFSSSLAVQVR